MSLVIFPPLEPDRLDAVRRAAGELPICNASSQEDALSPMPGATAFFGKMTPELLARSPSLRWVQAPTASLEHYLFPELIAHPCTLTNMRGLFGDVVAEHVFAVLLCFARNLHHYLRRQSAGRWEPVGGGSGADFLTGPGVVTPVDAAHHTLEEWRIAVIGAGGIGAEVLRRAAAWGLSAVGVDPHPRPISGIEVRPLDRLDETLADSDVVVIAAPQTPRTTGLFHAERLARMKRGALLVNVGRGAIVETKALVAALRSGHLGGAALDVLETEPLPPGHPLWSMENVLLTPHVAAASPLIARRHLELLVENVERFVAGKPLRNVVDKQDWC